MGEFVWENPVFWSFFAKIYTVPVSPEERKRRMGRGWPGDAEHKKGTQERIPEPLLWGVIEMKTCSRLERREHISSEEFILRIV